MQLLDDDRQARVEGLIHLSQALAVVDDDHELLLVLDTFDLVDLRRDRSDRCISAAFDQVDRIQPALRLYRRELEFLPTRRDVTWLIAAQTRHAVPVEQVGAAAADFAAIQITQARQGFDAQLFFGFGEAKENSGCVVSQRDLVEQLFGEGSLAEGLMPTVDCLILREGRLLMIEDRCPLPGASGVV